MSKTRSSTPSSDQGHSNGAAKRTPASLWSSMRRILLLGRPYWTRLGISMVMTIGGSLVTLAVPLGLRELLDAVFETGDEGMLNRIALVLVGLFLLQAVLSFVGGYLLSWTGERVVADLRQRLYTHLHRLSLRFFADHRVGELTSRLTNDVSTVRAAVTSALVQVVSNTLQLGGSVVLMLLLNWRLSMVVFAIVPAATIASIYFGRYVRKLARTIQDQLAETTAIAEEAMSAIRVVKAFARGRYEAARYRTAIEDLFGTIIHKVIVERSFGTLVGLLFMGALIAVFWYGGREVLQDRLTAGDLVAFIFYALNVATGVRSLASLYSTFNSAAGASERLFELLDDRPDIRSPRSPQPLGRLRGNVTFEHVHFAYDVGHPVLRDINFEAAPGQLVALVGPSGAGKTTTLNLIPRFYDPAQGRVLVDGVDLRHVSLQALREQIAVVPQEAYLFSASVRDNLRYGRLDATDAEMEEAARAANAHDFIMALPKGYDTQVGERGIKLSAGQRQRVTIARALLRDARILLLDEATSALDAESEALVQEALDRLMQGRTTFVIAHRLATVRHADRILVIDDGQIVQEGTHAELSLQDGLYRNFAVLQFTDVAESPGAT